MSEFDSDKITESLLAFKVASDGRVGYKKVRSYSEAMDLQRSGIALYRIEAHYPDWNLIQVKIIPVGYQAQDVPAGGKLNELQAGTT